MARYYPIIYIRGYAMTVSERDETSADPFCGFNYGSTMYRATEDKKGKAEKFIFESPIIRLATEYQYQHVYQDGSDIMDPDWEGRKDDNGNTIPGIPAASVIIYRYYDDGSSYFGNGKSRNIEAYAQGLKELIEKVKILVLQNKNKDGSFIKDEDFRCYLVAHSMGGLVARAFLQSKDKTYHDAIKSVAKMFTFATPHNGIDVLGMNVPSWLSHEQQDTFNRKEMRRYLNLSDISPQFEDRVDLIPQSALPASKIFCMVGSNRSDYETLQGIVRNFVGHGSDGLVLIDNASLWGVDENNQAEQVATAYAFRSHSGYFGIVNSEEAYQNLVRFLFGDVRVDIWADIDNVTLPANLTAKDKVSGLYQFEFRAAPRGKRWFLTRRTSVEDSPACRTHQQLTTGSSQDKQVYLSSLFLAKRSRVDQTSNSLSYAMTFAAKVPDYTIDKRFWPDGHYEGADLFHGTATITLTPPASSDGIGDWTVTYGWSGNPQQYQQKIRFQTADDVVPLELPYANDAAPGIKGKIRMMVRPWS